ncbi:hypothetical protein OCH239_01530 [Roseivivax halodurans JCM 10272]|uniref:Uncharacterized protein n=1 Tax=Roseivivax halodurans JCM 10272 TaxID=1449350 RepID=X7ENF6_9RHOB|nr:hypothetical protein OCH239_01530 [Roseivivax halodurans JCM 10272]
MQTERRLRMPVPAPHVAGAWKAVAEAAVGTHVLTLAWALRPCYQHLMSIAAIIICCITC